MTPQATIGRRDRVALLWGGGLGDLLVVRPLVQRLAAYLDSPPHFCSARFARAGLWPQLGARVEEIALPRRPLAAIRRLRALGVFDWVYLGPHPTLRTRLLAHAMKARRVWVSPAPPGRYLGEAIVDDIARLGLGAPAQPYGEVPLFQPARPVADGGPIVVHLTARADWAAKRWPEERWSELLVRLLRESPLEVVCVGTLEERAEIDRILARVPELERRRVRVETGLDLAGLEGLIAASTGVVCHNSGVMHVAAAWAKPTVVLTGSSSHYWRPSTPSVVNLTSQACGLACNRTRCPVPTFHARCIADLPVDRVLDTVRAHVLGSR